MKISVIVPVYNVAQYITDCIDSLYAQSYNDMEVIFIDDCGHDNSIQLIEEYIATHDGKQCIIVRHEKNGGLSAARNTGIRHASGEYVLFLDSDDTLAPEAISIMVSALDEKDVDFVVGDYSVFGDKVMDSDLKLKGGRYYKKEILESYSKGELYVMAWNKLCKKEFLEREGLYFTEGLIHEDQIWSFQIACKASSMLVINTVTYNYRVRKSSIMTSMNLQKDALSYAKVYDSILSFLNSNPQYLNSLTYNIYEGKRSGILYSILKKGDKEAYSNIYPIFHKQCLISPIKAYKSGIIGGKYLFRDLHYIFPTKIGSFYKHLFYLVFYKMRNKEIEGAVWE